MKVFKKKYFIVNLQGYNSPNWIDSSPLLPSCDERVLILSTCNYNVHVGTACVHLRHSDMHPLNTTYLNPHHPSLPPAGNHSTSPVHGSTLGPLPGAIPNTLQARPAPLTAGVLEGAVPASLGPMVHPVGSVSPHQLWESQGATASRWCESKQWDQTNSRDTGQVSTTVAWWQRVWLYEGCYFVYTR